MGKKKVTYEETMPLEKAVDYLQGLVDELKEGGFTIISDEGPLSFRPLEDVELEVELEQKKGKQELEIELSWKSADYEEEEEGEEEEEEEEEEAAAEAAGEGEEESSKECPVAKALPFVVLAVMAFIAGLVAGRVAGKGKQGEPSEESGEQKE